MSNSSSGYYTQVIRHYENLLASEPWLRVELCWTVIKSAVDVLPNHELARRLTLGREYSIKRGRIDEYNSERTIHISFERTSEAVSLFQIGHHAGRNDILSELSINGAAYSINWDVRANNSLSYAVNGSTPLSVDIFDWEDESTSNASNDFPELQVLNLTENKRAAGLAAVELFSGMHLTPTWLNAVSDGFVFPYFPFGEREDLYTQRST